MGFAESVVIALVGFLLLSGYANSFSRQATNKMQSGDRIEWNSERDTYEVVERRKTDEEEEQFRRKATSAMAKIPMEYLFAAVFIMGGAFLSRLTTPWLGAAVALAVLVYCLPRYLKKIAGFPYEVDFYKKSLYKIRLFYIVLLLTMAGVVIWPAVRTLM